MSLCAHAQALTFVPTQAIGGVHATAAEAVARAPEAPLTWTAPDDVSPVRRGAPGSRSFASLTPPTPMPVHAHTQATEEEVPYARAHG